MRVFHENQGNDVHIQFWMDVVPRPRPVPQEGVTRPARDGMLRIPIARGMQECYYLPRDVAQMAGMIDFAPNPTTLVLFPARNPQAKGTNPNYKAALLGT